MSGNGVSGAMVCTPMPGRLKVDPYPIPGVELASVSACRQRTGSAVIGVCNGEGGGVDRSETSCRAKEGKKQTFHK